MQHPQYTTRQEFSYTLLQIQKEQFYRRYISIPHERFEFFNCCVPNLWVGISCSQIIHTHTQHLCCCLSNDERQCLLLKIRHYVWSISKGAHTHCTPGCVSLQCPLGRAKSHSQSKTKPKPQKTTTDIKTKCLHSSTTTSTLILLID